jgi:hypothetical protein
MLQARIMASTRVPDLQYGCELEKLCGTATRDIARADGSLQTFVKDKIYTQGLLLDLQLKMRHHGEESLL